MIEWGVFEWGMLALDILLIGGFAWSVRFAKKNGYPDLKREATVPATLIAIFSIVLLLYLFGVLRD